MNESRKEKNVAGNRATITHCQCNGKNVKAMIKYITEGYFGSGENSIRGKKRD